MESVLFDANDLWIDSSNQSNERVSQMQERDDHIRTRRRNHLDNGQTCDGTQTVAPSGSTKIGRLSESTAASSGLSVLNDQPTEPTLKR